MTNTCGKRLDPRAYLGSPPEGTSFNCVREPGHRGRHRNKQAVNTEGCLVWQDDVCLPEPS